MGQHPGRSQRIYKNVQKSLQVSLEFDLWKKGSRTSQRARISLFFSPPLLNLQFLDAGEFFLCFLFLFFWFCFCLFLVSSPPEEVLLHDSSVAVAVRQSCSSLVCPTGSIAPNSL